MKSLSKIVLPQKIDSKVLQYGGFILCLLYGFYELGKIFQKNEEFIATVKIDTFAVIFAVITGYFLVSVLMMLFNFIHWVFMRQFDQEKMAAKKYAFVIHENWLFIGVTQIAVSVAVWLGVAFPTLVFQEPGIAGILGTDKFSFLYKMYFISLCAIGILQLIGLIQLIRIKKSGLYWIGVALFVCLLGAVPRAVDATFNGGDYIQELKPALDIIINFAILFFSMRKVTIRQKTI